MSPEESTAGEAKEEAGVIGSVQSSELGRKYEKWGGVCTVQVFELQVERLLDHWDEMHLRDRRLVAPLEAVSLIDEEGLRAIFRKHFSIYG